MMCHAFVTSKAHDFKCGKRQPFPRYLRRIQQQGIRMFERLQQKWKVSASQLALILCTFAIGGSLTGYIAKKIMSFFNLEQTVLWFVIYILLLTIIWPLAVIVISIPFGQFGFFKRYLGRVARKLGIVSAVSPQQQPPSLKIAIFASGNGSNAQKIIDYFRDHAFIKVSLIVCNKPGAGVLKIAENESIPALLLEKEKFYKGNAYIDELKQQDIGFIVLAGFLWKVPVALIKAYPRKIINIHPALLPAYGGKGMYGYKVQEAVIAAHEKESGITIHFVDEIYDHGEIIFQATCPVTPDDTPGLLAQKIHRLEHEHFPRVIEGLLTK
jgi:formyltetrahydrofolate-dependent phosphoribosylglycinamide formyltransferase